MGFTPVTYSKILAPSLIGLALIGASEARAQAVPAQSSDTTAATVSELVVTAERRPQFASRVPGAITAFTGTELQQLDIRDLPDLAQVTPGMQLSRPKGAGLPTFVIRGVSLQDYNANNPGAASVYIDDVYQPSTAMGGVSLFDLDRIEVLKGPQGGLYGRNTSGGAIQVVSSKPVLDDFSAFGRVGYGSWRRWDVEGMVNLPLSPKVALRLSGLHEGGSGGWQTSLVNGQKWGAPDRTALRAQIRFLPTERMDINVKAEFGEDYSETPLARAIGAYSPPAGDFCPAVAAGRRDDANCLTLYQLTRMLKRQTPGLSPALQAADGSTTLSHPFNQLQNDNVAATLTGTYHFDGADLTSITAYDLFRFQQNYDFAATPDRLGLQVDNSHIGLVSQEFRLTSSGKRRFNWLLGASYAAEDFRDYRTIDIRDNLIVIQSLGIPASAASLAILELSYNQDTRSAAVFGNADYALTETLKLSGTIRYTEETKHYYNGVVSASRPLIVRLSALKADYELGDHISGKVSLDWTPTPGKLLYAYVSRGYKSGGIFGGFNQVAGQITPYDEETVWAYEGGFKTRWFGNRLQVDGAIFHYDYSKAQGFTNVPFQTTGVATVAYPLLTNIGDAKHNGVELESQWRPVRGLILKTGVAWLNAQWANSKVSYTSTDGLLIPLNGRQRPYAPKWSGFGLIRYEREVAGGVRAAGQVSGDFRSRLTGTATLVDQAIGNVKGYGLIDARFELTFDRHHATLAVYGKNLGDKRYRTFVSSDGLGSYTETFGEPRSWGVELSKRW